MIIRYVNFISEKVIVVDDEMKDIEKELISKRKNILTLSDYDDIINFLNSCDFSSKYNIFFLKGEESEFKCVNFFNIYYGNYNKFSKLMYNSTFIYFCDNNKKNNITNNNYNNFIENLIHVISHEYIHDRQHSRIKNYNNYYNKLINKPYFDDEHEIMAISHNIIRDFKHYHINKTDALNILRKPIEYYNKNKNSKNTPTYLIKIIEYYLKTKNDKVLKKYLRYCFDYADIYL